MIHVTDVSFTYRRRSMPAINAVSFRLQPGSVTAIIGKAGAGKSTLCALMAGFMPQFFRGDVTGTLCIDGRDPCTSSIIEMLPHVTMVTSQASTQISGVCFTVAEEVGLALQNLGYTVDEITERVTRALTLMDINHLAERSPFQLSGGQQQRVVIAAARPQSAHFDPRRAHRPTRSTGRSRTRRNVATAGAARTNDCGG